MSPYYNKSLTIEKGEKDYRKVLPDAAIYANDNNSNEIGQERKLFLRKEVENGQ